MTFVGLLHFKRLLLESDSFWTSLNNNLFLMLVVPLFVVPISLFLAACLRRGIWGSNFFRIVFFFPNLLGTVAATFLWMHLYNPKEGLINSLLQAAMNGLARAASWVLHAITFVSRHLHLSRPLHFVAVHVGLERLRSYVHAVIEAKPFDGYAWISPAHLYWALVPMFIWALCGFNMVLYLASMQSIPQDLYEAADIEGASPWRQFWTVTLPLIWEMLAISFVFMILAGMKAFDVIWLLTNQQPNDKTNVIGTRLVQVMFSEFNIGEATAMAVILFLLVFVSSATSLQVMKRESVDMS
jgi:raffinose/stachyose/melibiose transport system permease protein